MESTPPCLTRKLFVGGLSALTTTEMFRNHFAKYGRIVDIVVMSKQGRPRGFGFVTFETHTASEAAVQEPHWLGDRFVDVKRAVPGEQPAECSSNKIFIGGLQHDATTEDLRSYFSRYGPIADAVVMVDRRTKRSRGFGFIRFANGAQGSRAAAAVMQDAANHWINRKWVEVKRATPAASPPELSPSSPMTSTPSAAMDQQAEQRSPLASWSGSTPASAATPIRHHQLHGQRLCYDSNTALDCSGMYSPGWSAAAFSGIETGFGMGGFDVASDPSPVFSPIRRFAGSLPGFDVAMLGTTPMVRSAAIGSFGSTLHDGTDAAGFRQVASSSGSNSKECASSLHSSDTEEENRPAAANRALTPPPGRFSKKPMLPPGLGMMASPMKVELPSKSFEESASSGGLTLQDGLIKVLPMLSAW